MSDPQAKSLKINLKKNEVIKFKENGQWVQATILGRGKVTGRYKNWFKESRQDGKDNHSVDLENVEYEVVPANIEVPVDAEEVPANAEEAPVNTPGRSNPPRDQSLGVRFGAGEKERRKLEVDYRLSCR